MKRKAEASDEPPVRRDARAGERTTANLTRLLESKQFKNMDELNAFLADLTNAGGTISPPQPRTALEKAQDLMYDAWDAVGPRRVELARQALALSPDCADAYVLLGEETAATPQAALEWFNKGVAAGERALGAPAFKDLVGRFWGVLDTRPYMRARLAMAQTLWGLGQHEAAVSHLNEMLRLNPGDNQGVRYPLLAHLLEMKRDNDAEKLMTRYGNEATAAWQFSRALLTFRRFGGSQEARSQLATAVLTNHFVPQLMFGLRKVPNEMPEMYSIGDEREAILFLLDFFGGWSTTPDAMEWFARVLESDPLARRAMEEGFLSTVTPDDAMAYQIGQWRKEQNAKPISLDSSLRAALNKCPWQWIDGMAVHLGFGAKGEKRDKVAKIATHLADPEKLKAIVAALPPHAQEALRLALKDGWIKYGEMTKRFGKEDEDGWWWAEDPPTSILGQLRLAGFLVVGTAPLGGRNFKVAVVPLDLRPLLKEALKA